VLAGSHLGHLVKSISSGAQYVICTMKLDEEKSKHAGLGCMRKMVFGSSEFHSLRWLVKKGATQVCTCTKECNKYDLTAVALSVFLIGSS